MKNNWQIKKLGELCDVIAGQSPEGKFYNKNGDGLPFYQGKKDFGEKFIGNPTTWTTHVIKEAYKDDILMSVRAPVGPTNFATGKICIGRGLSAIRTLGEIDKDYLFYFFEKFESEITGNTGAVFNSISKNQIENISIPFVSLHEQRRIVKALDEVFEKIKKMKKNTKKNLQNSRDLFESYVENVFVNPEIDWKKKKLGDVVETTQGVQIQKSFQIKTFRNGYKRYLYISDFDHEKNLKYIEDKYPKKLVTKDDLIVVNTGASAGRIYRGIEGILSNNLFKVSFSKDVLDTDFLYYFVTSNIFKNFQKKIVRGTANPHMGHENFNLTPFSFPSLFEQKDIVKKLDELSEQTKALEEIYKQKLADLEELKKSILQKAFAGEL